MLKKLIKLMWILIKEFLKAAGVVSAILLVALAITFGIFYVAELIIYIYNLAGYDFAHSNRNIKTIILIPMLITCLFVIVYTPIRAAVCLIIEEWKKL